MRFKLELTNNVSNICRKAMEVICKYISDINCYTFSVYRATWTRDGTGESTAFSPAGDVTFQDGVGTGSSPNRKVPEELSTSSDFDS